MRVRPHYTHRTATSLGALTLAVAGAIPSGAIAQQSAGQGLSQMQAGYGASRYTTATAATGSTRDANGNRLIVDGIIQSGASTYSQSSGGVASTSSIGNGARNGSTAIGGATAIGNNLNVVVQGNHNTVIVNSTQTNTGNISAGTVLNGSLVFP
ncbi:holdfast anchoring protein HfaA [uncultured Brevundimonas sp.]|uniref:holdfast anchoring protein HfaA n=1 Tax=uncultured Brevundimonas sp. TaxID=213418 RepID=UPI0026028676|nr:holdfast anchoring protein HfaA [uncultured Brevundimonas sp.]